MDQGSNNIDKNDYPLFYMILGVFMTKFNQFGKIKSILQKAWDLMKNNYFPKRLFYQWVNQLNEQPDRIQQYQNFLDFVKDSKQNNDNMIQQIQKLFYSYQHYEYKRKLNNQVNHQIPQKIQQDKQNQNQKIQRSNSYDTIPYYSQNNQSQMIEMQKQQKKQKYIQNNKVQQVQIKQKKMILDDDQQQQQKFVERQKPVYQEPESSDFDMQMLKKMQQDQEMARKFQQQQDNYTRNHIRNKNKQQQQTLCQICYVDLYDGDVCILDNCGHLFHQNCIIQVFKVLISQNNFPLRCPNQSCKIQALQSDIKQALPKQLYEKYQSNTLKAYAQLHGDSVSWCPTANCGYMFFYEKDDNFRFQCLQCRKEYCLSCRCDWHKDMTCKQYKVSSTLSEDDKKFMDFVKGSKFKQCPKCKFWVEKNQGCDHMTCKCKFQFCYKCGGVFMKCQCIEKQKQMFQARRRDIQRIRQRRQQMKKQKLEKQEKKRLEKQEKQKQKQKQKQSKKSKQKASVTTRNAKKQSKK